MSSGEDIDIWYYSSILAKCMRQNGINFKEFYKLICSKSTVEKADKAKELAFRFAQLPLGFLSHRIELMEEKGVEPLRLPEMENTDEKCVTGGGSLSQPDNASSVQLSSSIIDEDLLQKDSEMSLVHPPSCINRFIDDDAEETKSEWQSSLFRHDLSAEQACSSKSDKPNEQFIIEMNDMPSSHSVRIKNYDTSGKTLLTENDLLKEQHNKMNWKGLTSINSVVSTGDMTSVIVNEPSTDDNQKASKKKRKVKSKDIVVDGAHLSLQKSAYGNYGSSSETQPLLGHDSKSAMANSTSSHKSKKLNRRSGAEVKRYGSDDRVQFSKAVNRNLVEQAKLSDETLQKILEMCGDTVEDISGSKKKNNSAKKDKKKLKKQKKGEKKKTPEPKQISDTEESDATPKASVVEAASEDLAVVSPTPMDVDEEEFVTQRRKKTLHKHPASGRNSPHKFETARKRRFSDPSPAIPDNTASGRENLTAEKKEKQKTESKNWTHNVAYNETSNVDPQNELYDRTIHAQWPTLSSQVDSNSSRNPTALTADSYASKLKSNLDSTGCSLASSSEESSSSSSSTNNYQVRSGDRASPVHNYATALSDISRTIHAAAGFVHDKLEQSALHDNTPMEVLQPVNLLNMVKNVQEKYVENVNDEKTKKQPECETLKSFDANKTTKPKTLESSTSGKTKAKVAEKVQSGAQALDRSDFKQPVESIFNELQNKFGLTFIIDDLSNLSGDLLASTDNPPLCNSTSMQFTFGDEDLFLDQLSNDKHDGANQNTAQTVEASFEARLKEKLSNWNYDIGNFDMEKATSTLFREWKKALEKGTYYHDLKD